MEGILKRAKSGEDFSELVKQYTEDRGSKDKGGLYENFSRGKMVKPFENAAFSVPVGQISDIVETNYGYHILKIIDRKKDPNIKEKFLKEQKRKLYINYVDKIKEEYHFTVNEL